MSGAAGKSGELAGRIAVVTGAGSDIGRAAALALSREGAVVALLERDPDGLKETAGLIEAAGGTCLAIACDVSDAAAVDAAAEQVAKALGPCRILVNNAGIIRPGALADLSVADWSLVLGINLTGCFLCARAFGAQMRAEGQGEMVHLASIASDFATPLAGAYSVTKAGVAMLSRQLAIELGPDTPEMQRVIAAERARTARLYPDSPRYGLELDPLEYRKALARARKRGQGNRREVA